MRVLLIEDDSATAQSIELMLKSESFNVYTTDLGEEGVDLGKLYDYDIILLDLNLPDMSGFEVFVAAGLQGQDTDPDPFRPRRHRGQGQGPRLRRRRLHDQAVPQGRADRAHPRHRAPLQGPRPVGHQHRRSGGQPRHQDGRSQRPARAPHRQRIPDARVALAAQRHDAHQGDVPQSSLRRHGRARAQDHRRLHLQAAQEAGQRLLGQELHRDGVGPRLRAARATDMEERIPA